MVYGQISIKELVDPFIRESVKASKKQPTALAVAKSPPAVGRSFSGLSAQPQRKLPA